MLKTDCSPANAQKRFTAKKYNTANYKNLCKKEGKIMNKIKRIAFLLVAALFAGIFTGCGASSANGPAAGDPGTTSAAGDAATIKIAMDSITSIDPIDATNATNLQFVRNAYDTLVQTVWGTTKIEEDLAVNWDSNDDLTVWTFTLRDGVKFQDGTDFTSEAIKVNIERAQALGYGISYLFSNIESVETPDDSTVVLNLAEPDSTILYSLAMLGIASPTAIAENEVDGDLAVGWLSRNTAGTGAYQTVKFVDDQYAKLTRFEDYWKGWKNGDKQVENIEFYIVPQAATAFQMLNTGELDRICYPVIDYLDTIRGNDNIRLYVSSSLETDIFAINTVSVPDVRVRRAIQYAMDYASVANDILQGYADVPRGFLPTSFEGFDDSMAEAQYDLERAKALLDEAGVTDLTLELHIMKERQHMLLAAQLLQSGLRQIGVTLNITEETWPTLAEVCSSADTAPDLAGLEMGASTGDEINFLAQNFASYNIGTGYNWSFYDNEKFDSLLVQAKAEKDPDTKNKLLAQAQELLAEEATAVFITSPQKVEVLSNEYDGYVANPLDYYYGIRVYDLTIVQ